MTHTVLARKWRPKKFTDLVGQKSTVTILQNIITSNRLHHAYLLTGTRGVGKTTIARIIAKALNCLSPVNNEPCGHCENCLQIDIGRFVDVIEIDAASNTGVDNIREVLENAQYAPSSGKYKIYIIDEVHMLSKSAFNAMLKTLEEPPAHVVFILATTDPQKVPITILSRCLQLKLRNLSAPEIKQHLAYVLAAEGYEFEDLALEVLATSANGSMRDALSLTDQAIAFTNDTISLAIVQQMLGISDDGNILAILQSIATCNSNQVVQICQRLNDDGANLENILEQINQAWFQIALIQLSEQQNTRIEYIELAKNISLQDCQLYFEISNLGLEQIRKVSQKYPLLTMTLLRMVAFTIGSNEQKQIVISSNNCTTEIITTHENIGNAPSPVIAGKINEQPPSIAKPIAKEKIIINELPEIVHTYDTPPWEQSPNDETNLIMDTSTDEIITEQLEITSSTGTKNNITTDKFISWLEFVKSLDLNELPVNVGVALKNSLQIGNIEQNEIKLQINDAYRPTVDASCVDFIETLLSEKYATHFDLSFDFNTTTTGELKEFETNKAIQTQQTAEESIYNDETIKDLVTNFSAKILKITPR